MNTAQHSQHSKDILSIIKRGYYVDLAEGKIYTPEHQQMVLKPRGNAPLALTFRVRMGKRRVVIRAAKFVATFVYGVLALHPLIGVEFRDGNPTNLRGENLMLFRPKQENGTTPIYSRRPQSVEADANFAAMMGYISERRAERAALDTKRRDFFVRRATLLLIDELKNLLYKHGVTMIDFEQDEFQIERNEQVILWQLAEYLTRETITDESYERMIRPHQLSKYFAATALNLHLRFDDPDCFEIIDLEAEGDDSDE